MSKLLKKLSLGNTGITIYTTSAMATSGSGILDKNGWIIKIGLRGSFEDTYSTLLHELMEVYMLANKMKFINCEYIGRREHYELTQGTFIFSHVDFDVMTEEIGKAMARVGNSSINLM